MQSDGDGIRGTRAASRQGRAALAVVGLVAAVTLTGCATPGSVRRVEDESRLAQTHVLELAQATDQLRKEIAALRGQIEAARRDLEQAIRDADARQREAGETMGKRVAAAEKRLDSLAGAVRGAEMSIGGLADQVAKLEAVSTTPPSSNRREARTKTGSRAIVPSPSADELFARGMESFKNGELAQAILDFEDFVGRNPTHALAGTAQFLIGEAYYNARDYQHATVEYRKAVDMAPKGEKTPDALLKLGLAYRALKRSDRARETWSQLVQEFPRSEAAQKARAPLREVSRGAKSGATGDR